ncbi:MAG: murB [Herminiimonas sp.]|nr:murB [Herminiimonas sp.]
MPRPLAFYPDFPLRSLNSFGIEAQAKAYLPVRSADDLRTCRADSALDALPRLVLGGGSNILLTGDFPGLVLHMCGKGIEIIGADADATFVRVAAGENWHGFVLWTLAAGLGGLENLSLIPGTVGAAPIQNIGAYGVELQDCFHSLSAFDFGTGDVFTLDRAACEFGYRDSAFKHRWRDRAAILDVTFALPKRWRANLAYAELARELETLAAPTAQEISAAVIAIRTRKLPDPAVIGNAGSFFKNPVVSADQRDALQLRHPNLVSHRQFDGSYKLAAGWLIDQCGWKGKAIGAAGVYDRQALVLVNRGGASGQDILHLAHMIQTDVREHFGIMLEPEPVLI